MARRDREARTKYPRRRGRPRRWRRRAADIRSGSELAVLLGARRRPHCVRWPARRSLERVGCVAPDSSAHAVDTLHVGRGARTVSVVVAAWRPDSVRALNRYRWFVDDKDAVAADFSAAARSISTFLLRET